MRKATEGWNMNNSSYKKSARRELLNQFGCLGLPAFILLAFVIPIIFLFTSYYLHKDDWKTATTPLSAETVMHLCNQFALSHTGPLCDGSKDVYAVDFSEVLRDYFHVEDSDRLPKSQTTITYNEVENIIGKYKVECQEVEYFPELSFSSFRCFYDFRGDGYWRYAFYFYYPEETLYAIRSGSIGDD